MPHEFESGFSVRSPMWHGLGMVAERNPHSVDEALEWAAAAWEPIAVPIFATKSSEQCQSSGGCANLAVSTATRTKDGATFFACGRHSMAAAEAGLTVTPLPLRQVPAFQGVMRSDNLAMLNVANHTYEIFSNRETFELVELLLDSQAPKVKFETGGVLKGGRLVWALARVDEPLEVPGDHSPIYPYVSVLNSHDGSAALRAINTSIRIVCWNTWSAAESQASESKREFAFRHTGTIRDRVEAARQVLFGARSEAQEWVDYATRMVAIPIEDKQVQRFLTEFVPMPPTAASDRVVENVEAARNAIKKFYHSPSCATIAGTAWGLINAVGEYLDHGRTFRTKETYVSRTLLRPEKGKQQALKLIEQLVGADA